MSEPAEHLLLHAALPDDWSEAERTGTYRWSTRGVTLEQEGFVHCSYPGQLDGVVARFYADVDALAILMIDRRQLGVPVVDEPPAEGVDELFPHVYGPIPVDAVTDVIQWRVDDGVAPSARVDAATSDGATGPASG